MSSSAQVPCSEVGCFNLVRSGRCPECRKADGPKGYESRRRSARDRGYDRAWERRRRRHLEAEPWCRQCGETGNQVDHVIPHRGAKWLFDLKGNLQTLCRTCHGVKGSQEQIMPIGMMYPLEWPKPKRRTLLLCGPQIWYDVQSRVTVIDWNIGIRRTEGFRVKSEAGSGLETRNRWLREELLLEFDRVTGMELWLVVPAPRVAERAYWSHVMGVEAQLIMAPELAPTDWWADYDLDQRAEEAMARRRER